MRKYSWNDLIVNPSSEEAKFCLGKEVYFSDVPASCLEYANSSRTVNLGKLEDIDFDLKFPFIIMKGDSRLTSTSIILKRESELEYVPFESADEFLTAYLNKCDSVIKKDKTTNEDVLSYHGIWLKREYTCCCDFYSVTEIRGKAGLVIGNDTNVTSWDVVLSYKFLDGTPCGKIKRNRED